MFSCAWLGNSDGVEPIQRNLTLQWLVLCESRISQKPTHTLDPGLQLCEILHWLGLTIALDYSESFLCKSVQLYFSIVIGNKVKCVLRILPSASGLRLFTNQQILRLSTEAFFLFWIWGVQLSIIETFCPTDWSSHIAFCEAKRFELLFQAAGVLLPIKVNDCLHSICHSLRSRNWLEWVFSAPVFAPS